jgi:hypothetical protein
MSLQIAETTSALDSCRHAESTIREVQQMLLKPQPETLDRCRLELDRVITTLEALVAAGPQNWSVAESVAFHQIKLAAGLLRMQIEHASNYWLGWLQLWLGNGYSERGLPVFAEAEAQRSFEG